MNPGSSGHLPVPADPNATALEATAALAPLAQYEAPPEVSEEPAFDPRRLLSAFYRYKWLLVAVTAAGLGAGMLMGRLQSPTYEAQATVWIEMGSGSRGPLQAGALTQALNWQELAKSYVVLDSVVKGLKLYLSPASQEDAALVQALDLQDRFVPGAYQVVVAREGGTFELVREGSGTVQRGNVGDSVGVDVGFLWLPPSTELRPGRTIAFSVTSPRQAALGILANLETKIPVIEGGNFLRLKLVGSNPVRTAATLNAICDQFVRVAAILKREKLSEMTRILREQLDTAASNMRRAELAHESFRVRTITLPGEDAPPINAGLASTQPMALSNYFTLKTQADALRRDREQIERVLASPPESGLTEVQLGIIPSVQTSADLKTALADLTAKFAMLRTLRARYTDDNPQVRQQLNDIRLSQQVQIPSLLRELLNDMRTRERDLERRVQESATDLRQIPVRTIEEGRLAREVTIATGLYTTLQQRYSEAQLAEASSVPDVRILDAAVVPDRPTKDMSMIMLLAGIGGGLGAGLLGVFMLDKFDKRVRYPDQVTRELGLSILGAIPRAKTNGGLRATDTAAVVEALRSVRLNVVHAYGSAGPFITVVTSPGSGDGKSFLASNLSLAFADAGHRTLLIDGDIRRGTLHRVLGAQRKPGLLDYLSGHATREQVVQNSRVPAVDFIGCGTRKMGGPELLASPAMSQLLISLRSQYSVIIIDSAPLGAGVDPLVLGSLTGSLMLVLRTGVTDRELASAKLDSLHRLPIRVLGAVLNDVKPEGVYKYYSYLPGYSSEDETLAAAGEVGVLPAGK